MNESSSPILSPEKREEYQSIIDDPAVYPTTAGGYRIALEHGLTVAPTKKKKEKESINLDVWIPLSLTILVILIMLIYKN